MLEDLLVVSDIERKHCGYFYRRNDPHCMLIDKITDPAHAYQMPELNTPEYLC